MLPLRSITIAVVLAATSAVQAAEITLLDANDFGWEKTPEGVAFAPLTGDRFAGPYQALVELPPGTVSPPHTKSATMYGVLLQGEMIHHLSTDDPETARRVGAGSYYQIPAGLPHVSACVSDVPFLAYLYQDGAFDFIPVQP